MSWTSEWMADWLQAGEKRRTQVELAALAGTDPANVSRWMNGQSRPDRDAIERLAERLEPAEAGRLAIAWLRDQTPPNARLLVRVEPASIGLAESPDERFPEGISAELRERLLFFGRLAIENPSIRRIIDVCYEAARRSGGAK